MAKKSKIARNQQRAVVVERYRTQRAELKKALVDPSSSDEQREAARIGLQKLPRDASPVRLRNRDVIDGRPRGHLSKFGISRIPIGVLDMLAVWFELRFGQKPLLLFGMLGAGLFSVGALAGIVALGVYFAFDAGVRAVWTIIQTCLILGSIFFATGLLGEQIAGERAQLREIRRQLDEIAADRAARR